MMVTGEMDEACLCADHEQDTTPSMNSGGICQISGPFPPTPPSQIRLEGKACFSLPLLASQPPPSPIS